MVCVAKSVWVDSYLTGVDHHVNGTSAYNVTIADNGSPPKVPDTFGGDGTTTYGSYNWYAAAELLASHGKRLPTQQEFMALAYGVTEETAPGATPGSTGLDAARTSKWGIMQATGNMWIWGNHHGGRIADGGWTDNTGGRGESRSQPAAVWFGGASPQPTRAGSRSSQWFEPPDVAFGSIGSRGVCDHYRSEV
jgi:hypothetical protein